MSETKIAVIGGGIYGCTIAIKLAKEGYEIDLFEREGDILQAASGINQYRMHRGYHYPRSVTTGISSRYAYPLFVEEYKGAIIEDNDHYYCIPKEKSKVTGKDFIEFCKQSDLYHEEANVDWINKDMFDLVIKAEETLMDPNKIREIIRKRIEDLKVNLFLNTEVDYARVSNYSYVINATYAKLNHCIDGAFLTKKEYQFEVCEKPLLKLPDKFKKISAVVMDGPFFCIDPYSNTEFHLMGNVVHAIHSANTGHYPEIPEQIKPLLNRGIVENPRVTNIDKFIEVASMYMPMLKDAVHIGSMYTIRTVLPRVDHTDERPTIVTRINDKIINVFSGKLGNCVHAANEVLRLIRG